jgi:predicted phosphodiesterase
VATDRSRRLVSFNRAFPMPRTLIISDLHIGGRFFHTVLTRPEPLARLLAALDDIDRLVILGDAVELMERRPRRSMELAEPIITAIGRRLGPAKEVIVVPGNHDAPFVRSWVSQVGDRLQTETDVPLDCTPWLHAFTSWLAPARVRVSYPGVWLQAGVWATHGHYQDVHLMPVSSYGIARGRLHALPHDRATPFEYEHRRRHRRTHVTRTSKLARGGAWLLDQTGELIRAGMSTVIKHQLLQPRLSRLNAAVLKAQVHHAGIPALARVVHRLGIDADLVIYGHCHRLGPLAGDDPSLWQGPNGRPRIINTGSWLYESPVAHGVQPPNPYWPGGAVLLDDGPPARDPRPFGLLDDLPAEALRTDY